MKIGRSEENSLIYGSNVTVEHRTARHWVVGDYCYDVTNFVRALRISKLTAE